MVKGFWDVYDPLMLSLANTSGIKNAIVRQPHVLTKQPDRENRLKEKKKQNNYDKALLLPLGN